MGGQILPCIQTEKAKRVSENTRETPFTSCDCSRLGWFKTWIRKGELCTPHHPSCEKFEERKEFVEVSHCGSGGLILTKEAAIETFRDELECVELGDELEYKIVEMYQQDFDALPEFQGF